MAYNQLSSDEIRENIIDEAKKSFFNNGIANTQMKDIATAAGIGRSTLYRYYSNKEQLAFLITGEMLSDFHSKAYSKSHFNSPNGYLELVNFYKEYIFIMSQNIHIINYLLEFDRLFINEYPTYPEVTFFLDTLSQLNKLSTNIIKRGIEDGSITTDEEPSMIAATFTNSIYGLAQRVLVRSSHIQEEHGFSGMSILENLTTLLFKTIKSSQ